MNLNQWVMLFVIIVGSAAAILVLACVLAGPPGPRNDGSL